MNKYDIYLQENSNTLKNKLGITNEKDLDVAESMMVRTRMTLLYNSGFSDFSAKGFCELHKILFGDVYDWAGKYREINVRKSEPILVGKSVWYSNWDAIDKDLNNCWNKINKVDWHSLNHKEFAENIAHLFPTIWQVHPFREGNTRTTVMMIALFVEHYGYYFDYELMANSAGYVRNAFVLCCFDDNSEFEHLERILFDAISEEPIEDYVDSENVIETKNSKYEKYYTKDYTPTPHEYIEK
ncbi:Fic/DOC family protein [Ruminococcus sp.]|uniref:Fic/DOC family protein n=1 Tax=Ruminococcus sp. TaxID=41978 RepID=UPI002E80AEF0|nr:Fic family protein [Ruminococcus sp.]MEE3438606.1 Fic family protein [Ruminococcus sp.]